MKLAESITAFGDLSDAAESFATREIREIVGDLMCGCWKCVGICLFCWDKSV
jgi:hypothetical protein